MHKYLLACCILLGLNTQAQNIDNQSLVYGASFKGGFLMAHRAHMSHLVHKNAYGFELNVSKQHVEDSFFAKSSRYSLSGLAFEFRNFGYDEVLGQSFSLSQFTTYPLLQTKHHFFIDFRMESGVAYITKTYDKELNPKNNAIGSHINAKAGLQFRFTQYFNQFYLGLGVEMSHFSNGAIQYPNLGLNNASVLFNVGYAPNSRESYQKSHPLDKHLDDKSASLMVVLIGSVKERVPVPYDAKKYPVFAGRFSWVKPINKKWNYELGVDLVYNKANQYYFSDTTYASSAVPQMGVYAGMSLNYYQSQLFFGFGYYFLDKINPMGREYNRIGYRYFFTEHWSGLFSIRANFGKADFFDFGVAYKW